MNADKNAQVLALLDTLEKEMQELKLWGQEAPSDAALQSVEPFAVDTLQFNEWLQWIFIPRLGAMAHANIALPYASGIAEMAEEWLPARGINGSELLVVLRTLDKMLSTTVIE